MLAKFILGITPLESIDLYQGWTWLRSLHLLKAVVSLYTFIVYIHIYTYQIKITNIHWVHLKMVLLLETTVCEACLYSKGILITFNLSLWQPNLLSKVCILVFIFTAVCAIEANIVQLSVQRVSRCRMFYIRWCYWHFSEKWLDDEGIDWRQA